MNENTTEKNELFSIDVRKLLLACLNKLWLIILLGVLGAAVAFAYTFHFIPATYNATTSIIVSNTNSVKYMLDASANMNNTERLVKTYINILRSDRVMEQVQEAVGGDYTLKEIKNMISAAQVDTTEMFTITVTHTDPKAAAEIANVASDTVIDAIMELIRETSANVLDYAKVPTTRSGPNYQKNTLIGAAVGIVLAVGIIALIVITDVRIKDEEDLNAMFEYPVLGRVPEFSSIAKSGKGYGYKYEKDTVKGYGYKYEKEKTVRKPSEKPKTEQTAAADAGTEETK